MADPFAGRRYQDRTGKGIYEEANSGLLKGAEDYFARRNQEAAEARRRVAEAYESGGLGRALGRTAREVYDNAVGKVGAVRDAVLGLRRMQAEAGNQVIAGFTGEEVRPQAAPTPTPEGAQERTFGAAGSREGDLGKGLPPGYKVSNTGVDGVYRVDGGSSPLFTNLNPAEAVKGLRGGTVNTINMRAGNEALARANAIRQEYLDSQAGSDGGPRGGSIGGGGSRKYGLRFNRRSEERAADRAQRQAWLQLNREKFEFDKTPKPLSELEKVQLEGALYGLRERVADRVRKELEGRGLTPDQQNAVLENVGESLVDTDPVMMQIELARHLPTVRATELANQYSLGGVTSAGDVTPVGLRGYKLSEVDLFGNEDPNAPTLSEYLWNLGNDKAIIEDSAGAVGEGGAPGKPVRLINVARVKASGDGKNIDVLRRLGIE